MGRDGMWFLWWAMIDNNSFFCFDGLCYRLSMVTHNYLNWNTSKDVLHSFNQDNQRATAFWTPGTSISDLQHLSQASCSPFGVIENNSALIKTPSAASHLLRLSSTKQCSKCLGKWCILPDSGQHNITLRSRKRSEDPEAVSYTHLRAHET